MNLRKKIFFIVNFLKTRNVIKEYCKEIISYMHLGCNNDKQLEHILLWASENVEFYKNRNLNKLTDFPVVNKSIIKENEALFISKKYNKADLHKTRTSGSEGIPFVAYQDEGKKLRNLADTIVFSEMAGYEIGTKLYYLRAWTDFNRKTKLASFLQNFVLVDSVKLSDENIKNFLNKLEKDKKRKSILAYASSLVAICKCITKKNIRVSSKIDAIISGSEYLPEDVKQTLKVLFKTNVVSRYSNCENGMLAQQTIDGDDFIINTASYHIEILDVNTDEPVRDGEMGRIVVTDLYNHAMPFIRYDTGDIGVKRGNVLEKVFGRNVDFLTATSGELISPYAVVNFMQGCSDIKQFQLVQEGKSIYVMKLVYNGDEKYPNENNILTALKEFFGDDAQICIEYVDEIPNLSSGKYRYVVNKSKA